MTIPVAGWVAPFGDPRIKGCSPLPTAYRSVPRPSSPLDAKASTRCPSHTRPAPAATMTIHREETSLRIDGRARARSSTPILNHMHTRSTRRTANALSPGCSHPCSDAPDGPGTSRDIRRPTGRAHAPPTSSRCTKNSGGTAGPTDKSPDLSARRTGRRSGHGGPGPIRTADLTLIRGAL